MEYNITLPITTGRLLIDDFRWDDFNRLLEIAVRMNGGEEKNDFAGHAAPRALDAKSYAQMKTRVIWFVEKAEAEMVKNPRMTYRMAIRMEQMSAGEYELGAGEVPKFHLIGGITVRMEQTDREGWNFLGNLSCFIDPEYGYFGFGTESAFALLKQYFGRHQIMDASIAPSNKFAMSLAEKIGATQSGPGERRGRLGEIRHRFEIRRNTFLEKLGEWQNANYRN